MGISTATLSKYRSIIKLPDNLIESIGRLLDPKRISFEMVYLISRLHFINIMTLVHYIDKYSDREVDKDELMKMCVNTKKNKKQGTIMSIYSDAAIASLLVPKAGSEIFKTIPN